MKKLLIPCLFLLPGGLCSEPEPPVASEEALFCDIEEKRVFTQEEVDWRGANAPWNLRRDFSTNLAWEAECEIKVALGQASQ